MQEYDPKETKKEETFRSETQKIIHRHLDNEHDEITDEDIRNVRIGVTPPASTQKETVNQSGTTNANDQTSGDEPITPWDTIKE